MAVKYQIKDGKFVRDPDTGRMIIVEEGSDCCCSAATCPKYAITFASLPACAAAIEGREFILSYDPLLSFADGGLGEGMGVGYSGCLDGFVATLAYDSIGGTRRLQVVDPDGHVVFWSSGDRLTLTDTTLSATSDSFDDPSDLYDGCSLDPLIY